jgi:uncharacterized membrane protein
MAELGNAKFLGGIGAILLLIGGFIPWAGPIVSIVGLVLIFIAVKTISDLTKDKDIFRNYLISFIFSILSIVAIFVIMLMAFGAAGGFTWLSSLENVEITDFDSFWASFGSIIGGCILALFAAWILSIIGALYLKKSYNSIAKHTKVGLFKTTGTVYFIGAITTIIGIGFLILLIARIIEIIAYFSLPDDLSFKKNEQSGRKCLHCARLIPEDAVLCPYCSKKFEE